MEEGARPEKTATGARSKRRRLNFACNYCRSRKTRCDEQKPSCHACTVAEVPCITTDKRRPGVDIERHGAGSPSRYRSVPASSPQSFAATDRTPASLSVGETTYLPVREQSSVTSHDQLGFVESQTSAVPLLLNIGAAIPSAQSAPDVQEGDHLTGESPPNSRATRFVGRLPFFLHITGRNTLEILTAWLGIALFRLGMPHDFRNLLAHEKEPRALQFSLPPIIPALPDSDECQRLMGLYFKAVYPIFPAISPSRAQEALRSVSSLGNEAPVWEADLSARLLVYLIISLGSQVDRGAAVDRSSTYLSFCKAMLGQVVEMLSIEAVQILFLLSLALRCQDQVSSPWSTLSLCVSMAMSIGLNHRKGVHPARKADAGIDNTEEENYRIWWSIYSFEKLFAFELGRPSSIRDQDYEQHTTETRPSTGYGEKPNFFEITISLAKLIGEINMKGLRAGHKEETNIEAGVADKVQVTGESLLLLMSWADALPAGIK